MSWSKGADINRLSQQLIVFIWPQQYELMWISLWLYSVLQVLWSGQRKRHGHFPRLRFLELPSQHATGHGGCRSRGWRRRSCHLLHGRCLWPHETEIFPGLLCESGRRAGQSWNSHPLHQGENRKRNWGCRCLFKPVFGLEDFKVFDAEKFGQTFFFLKPSTKSEFELSWSSVVLLVSNFTKYENIS